ncbi:hypothetical protein [Burkholderia ubonensis]|uniref:hypothetical protein n=1 Tax=Burkholderia ubonensis TaxID=101571 RepID=UPI000AAEF30D|nr:hypothetical protein [Burkholderia ubonensis]
MSFLGNFLPFVQDTFGEIKSHPLQAAGAALGVPGYDPFFGGLFNNHPGGALLSPTGNFTSSAWQDMRNANPGDAGALDQFSHINSIADKIAPMIAGSYAAPALGGLMGGGTTGAGASGLTGFFSGPAAVGDSGLTGVVSPAGSGLGSAMSGDLGGALGSSPTGLFSGLLPGGGMSSTASGALGGGLSGDVAGVAPLGGASMGGFSLGSLGNLGQLGQQMLQQRNQQPKQEDLSPLHPVALGNPHALTGIYSPSLAYARFNQVAPTANPAFGFGGGYGTL